MIKVENLWKTYRGHAVLQGLNLEVKESQIVVILGRSGVGKSVLLRHLIGIEKPDQGLIEVDGIRLSEVPQKEMYNCVKNMGMLFQGAALFDSMNIFENVAFHLKEHGNPQTGEMYTEEEITEKVMAALQMVSLEKEGAKLPSDLSGGMKKRAGLARLIAYRPKILLYDEPTTGLDPITAQQINELIVQIQNELKGTSVVVTHDVHSAMYIADLLALHEDGRIKYIDQPENFLDIDDPVIAFLKDTMSHHPRARG